MEILETNNDEIVCEYVGYEFLIPKTDFFNFICKSGKNIIDETPCFFHGIGVVEMRGFKINSFESYIGFVSFHHFKEDVKEYLHNFGTIQ